MRFGKAYVLFVTKVVGLVETSRCFISASCQPWPCYWLTNSDSVYTWHCMVILRVQQ